MITYYYLDGKSYDGDEFEKDQAGDLKEILQKFKEKVRERVDIRPELARISRADLPSPRYRASVYRYLSEFFLTGNFPAPSIIDYSDFQGSIRPFPPREPDEEMQTTYESFLGFHETFCNDDVTEYDYELGFVFAVNRQGFHLEMLGRNRDTIAFYFRDRGGFRGFAFNPYRGASVSPHRSSWHMRIQTSTDKSLTMLSGSYPVVMLLSYLLEATNKKPLDLDEYDLEKLKIDRADHCLAWALNHDLHEKINNERFVLPKKTKFDVTTLEGYIQRLVAFGYDVKTVTTEIKEYDYKGDPIRRVTRDYYLPPFICKRDSSLILQCIENASLPEAERRGLIQKYKTESGCLRYAKDELEESEIPTPSVQRRPDNDYALIIYTVLRRAARPLAISSTTRDAAKKKDNLRDLIVKYYGFPRNRTTISDNIYSMMAVGLPILKVGQKYTFDESRMLTARELDLITSCVTHSTVPDGDTRSRLINKLKKLHTTMG